MKSVLLTRSKTFNSEIREALTKCEYEFLECDLIKYTLQPFDPLELSGFQNIIITSYFASLNAPNYRPEFTSHPELTSHLDASFRHPELDSGSNLHSKPHEIPDQARNDYVRNAWVVGANSAKILEAKGYNIQFCAGSAEELKNVIPAEIYKDTIYLSSDHITVNMPLLITRKIFYKVEYKESLSKGQILRYKQGIDYILLYSTNCAKTLMKLLQENNLMNYLENTMLIVISSKVERVVKDHFRNVRVCQGADLMLDYLEKQ